MTARILRRDPRAALHVPGAHFWSFAVGEGDAELSAVTQTPGDEASSELREVHAAFYGKINDEDAFYTQMIDASDSWFASTSTGSTAVLLDKPPGT